MPIPLVNLEDRHNPAGGAHVAVPSGRNEVHKVPACHPAHHNSFHRPLTRLPLHLR